MAARDQEDSKCFLDSWTRENPIHLNLLVHLSYDTTIYIFVALTEQLLNAVKVEVKRLMEEAVTKKFIHEGSSTVTSFCGKHDEPVGNSISLAVRCG